MTLYGLDGEFKKVEHELSWNKEGWYWECSCGRQFHNIDESERQFAQDIHDD